MDHRLLTVYFCVVLYALCFQMQSPVLPYLLRELSEDDDGGGDIAVTFGRMKTLFSIVQLFGGLVSGPLIDAFGCKILLVLSFASSALCYGLVGVADTLTLIYLSRIPTLFQHAVLASRVYITLGTSDGSDRATKLGYIGLSYGIGFAIGPAIGGVIGTYDLHLGAYVGAAGSLLGALLVLLLLEDPSNDSASGKKKSAKTDTDEGSSTHDGGIAGLIAVLGYPGVVPLLMAKAACALAAALFYSNFTLLSASQYGLDPDATGYFLSYIGILLMVVQGVLIKQLSSRFSEKTIGQACVAGLLLGTLGIAYAHTIGTLAIALIPVVVSGAVFANVNTVQLTRCVSKGESGCIVALDMAVGTGVRMISPMLGAYILSSLGYSWLGFTGAGLSALVLISYAIFPNRKAESKSKKVA